METPPTGDLVLDEVERPSCVYLRCDKDRCQGRQIGLVSVSAGLKVVQLVISDACRGLVESVADFLPEPHHQAFAGVLNGGIVGTLLDCHSNWTAAYTLMKARGLDHPPATVTAEFSVKLRAPTPLNERLRLVARSIAVEGDKVTVDARLEASAATTATCRGVFIAVKEGHPAYFRW